MILGYHVIFSTYGFWLPNDPRGSWSEFVGAWDLYRAGGYASKTAERRSLAHDPHDRTVRLATKSQLKRPPVKFDGHQALAAAQGFGEYVRTSRLAVWACAVMPDHAHLVLGPLRLAVEQVVIQLKAEATKRLIATGRHPFLHDRDRNGRPRKCWCRGEWKVFLNDPADLRRAVRYVERNPIEDGYRPQRWPFVTPCPYG